GIPMATDIAFALGLLALLGNKAPLTLKVFLTAVAIIDDIGAVLVIALFYTAHISWISLLVGVGFLAAAIAANRIGVTSALIYIILGIGLWVAFLKSGVHATIAGILLAMTIPLRRDASSPKTSDKAPPLLQRMEEALHPWVTFFVIPLFALANAGVTVGGDFMSNFSHSITLGVALGLFLGKQIGVLLFSWLAVRLRLAPLPEDLRWPQVYGASLLAGIGFTMSLFIGNLAFTDESALVLAKVGILSASAISAITGLSALWLIPAVRQQSTEKTSHTPPWGLSKK
ncbi:MAG TPA: Na+/H+ antiporter NhaA, partial [bacterium]